MEECLYNCEQILVCPEVIQPFKRLTNQFFCLTETSLFFKEHQQLTSWIASIVCIMYVFMLTRWHRKYHRLPKRPHVFLQLHVQNPSHNANYPESFATRWFHWLDMGRGNGSLKSQNSIQQADGFCSYWARFPVNYHLGFYYRRLYAYTGLIEIISNNKAFLQL